MNDQWPGVEGTIVLVKVRQSSDRENVDLDLAALQVETIRSADDEPEVTLPGDPAAFTVMSCCARCRTKHTHCQFVETEFKSKNVISGPAEPVSLLLQVCEVTVFANRRTPQCLQGHWLGPTSRLNGFSSISRTGVTK